MASFNIKNLITNKLIPLKHTIHLIVEKACSGKIYKFYNLTKFQLRKFLQLTVFRLMATFMNNWMALQWGVPSLFCLPTSV